MPLYSSSPWPKNKDILTMVPGRYYGNAISESLTTVTMAANTLYAVPIIVPDVLTFHQIALQVTTLAAAASVRLGIYKDRAMSGASDGGYPDALVLDAGTISVATTGGKTISINQTLFSGIYWLAGVSDGAPVVEAVSGSTPISWLGRLSNTETATTRVGYSVSFTYAALPDPFTGGGALLGTGTNVARFLLGT